VLTGLPSILAGVFAYAMVVVTTGSFSALAGGAAMAILMIPTIMLTSESALRAVPNKMKMAAFGMGATRAQVVLKIVIPTAIPGILTGVMLALARAMGHAEIAPEVLHKARIGDIRHCFCDTTLARRVLGFEPVEDFSSGLAELAEWVAGETADDRVAEARQELEARGLVA